MSRRSGLHVFNLHDECLEPLSSWRGNARSTCCCWRDAAEAATFLQRYCWDQSLSLSSRELRVQTRTKYRFVPPLGIDDLRTSRAPAHSNRVAKHCCQRQSESLAVGAKLKAELVRTTVASRSHKACSVRPQASVCEF